MYVLGIGITDIIKRNVYSLYKYLLIMTKICHIVWLQHMRNKRKSVIIVTIEHDHLNIIINCVGFFIYNSVMYIGANVL